ncbi:guanylate kinase [Chthonomonas calidirosea]|uniref:Guanylate kinase n=1 Tax=Chthonomonas calidirosea (strain DSM 23976 / ICMP 18418 / T49) TaxID=1303518 RepID=S0EV56_CHTCT|nr:guanylate kinase [Chthonomonas calidirosea]CCW35606.1 guanylate kinase [Chthonomonas calidirosea T49]CEK18765.1 guanylate kinase [Chthonomonas calidirosea]CEK18775.1 guanylate kinase [Chthonomonas calidirosea]CEK19771.1 guanylate kinase [Chthonomonas calidirosea]
MGDDEPTSEALLLPPRRRGNLLVVSGPSGVGKDTLIEKVLNQTPGVVRSISATTRPPREGERDGQDYFFLSSQQFEEAIKEGKFLEYARYGSYYYGTPRAPVEQQLQQGLDVVLKIEVQGALQVKRLFADAILIFIAPPSLQELRRRLTQRGTESEERIEERLRIALEELAAWPRYDYYVVNDFVETACEGLRAIVLAERLRIRNA